MQQTDHIDTDATRPKVLQITVIGSASLKQNFFSSFIMIECKDGPLRFLDLKMEGVLNNEDIEGWFDGLTMIVVLFTSHFSLLTGLENAAGGFFQQTQTIRFEWIQTHDDMHQIPFLSLKQPIRRFIACLEGEHDLTAMCLQSGGVRG